MRNPKSEVITIRLSPEHKAILQKAAKLSGLSVSSLLLANGLSVARSVVGSALPPRGGRGRSAREATK